MKNIYVVIVLLFIKNIAFAQSNIELNFQIVDKKTKEILTGATIKSGKIGKVSDIDGKAKLTLPSGKQKIEISFVGYETQTINENFVTNDFFVIQMIETENLLNSVTISAGKYEINQAQSVISVEVIKPKLLESNNAVQLDKALEKVPGLSVIGGQANIRGGSGFTYGAGSRVLVLQDDIPALQADAGQANWNDFAMENVEQIEIFKGAASALYGSSAMNGVINLRTGYARDKPITKVSTFYTGYMTPKDAAKKWWTKSPYQTGLSFSHKQKFGKTDLVFSGYGQKFESFNKDTYEDYGRITSSIRHRVTDKLSIGFNTNFNFGNSGSFYYWLNEKAGAYKGTASTITTTKKLRYTIDPYISYFDKNESRHKFLGRLMSVDNENALNTSNHSKLYYGEYQFQHNFKEIDLAVTAGLVGIHNKITAQLYGDTSYVTNNLSAYLQLDKKIGDRLNVSFGGRYESNATISPNYIYLYQNLFTKKNVYDTITGGRTKEAKPVFHFGMNYKLADFTFLRMSIGQAYRFPTIAEKFITTSLGNFPIIPNGKLTSETGWSSEIGIKQGFKIGQFQGFTDAAFFWTEYKDMMEFIFVRELPLRFQSQNIGDTRIKGAEFSISGLGAIGDTKLSLLAGYTTINPKFKTFGDREKMDSSDSTNILKYRFRQTAKFDLQAENHGVFIGVAYNYTSKMQAIDRIFEVAIPGVKAFRAAHNSGVGLLDLRVGYEFNKHIRLTLIAKNLLNEEYTVRPALLEAPRNLTARLDWEF